MPARTWAAVVVCACGLVFGQQIVPVTDINPGTAGSYPSYLTAVGEVLYFRANDTPSSPNCELWRYDGATPVLACEVYPGTEGSSPSDLVAYDGKLYFSASGPNVGTALWSFDGVTLTCIPGTSKTTPQELFVYDGMLFFRIADFAHTRGIELARYDGTTLDVLDLFPGSWQPPFSSTPQGYSSYPQHFTVFNGQLYFNACTALNTGTELHRYTGSGAVKVTHIAPDDDSSPEQLAVFGDRLFFSANDRVHGRELWCMDAAENYWLVTDEIFPGPESSNPAGLTVYRDAIYFCAEDGINGAELWRCDGTRAELVANINQNAYVPYIDPVHHSWPGDFFVFNDILFFSADDGVHGRELWCYDGNEVRMVADIYLGANGSYVGDFCEFAGALYFSADTPAGGAELTLKSMWQLSIQPAAAFVRGDANSSGRIDLSDAISVLLHMFGGTPAPRCLKAADANDDGALTIADAVTVLGYLFAHAPAPVEPFAACGIDPTPDQLTCTAFEPCR